MPPTYKGNRGNLLQHWVLAELMVIVQDIVAEPDGILCFIDAHAMSPYAVRDPDPGQTAADFDRVSGRLPGKNTAYEQAWDALRGGNIQYPSSAMFVRHLWPWSLQLVLSEIDGATADHIDDWFMTLNQNDAGADLYTHADLRRGDWRERFHGRFPQDASAYLISFDPNMLAANEVCRPRPENMYPSDIWRHLQAVIDQIATAAPIILQLSTYSAQDSNDQDTVRACIEPSLARAGLNLAATVFAHGRQGKDRQMMSMVFVRNCPMEPIEALPNAFWNWHGRVVEDE